MRYCEQPFRRAVYCAVTNLKNVVLVWRERTAEGTVGFATFPVPMSGWGWGLLLFVLFASPQKLGEPSFEGEPCIAGTLLARGATVEVYACAYAGLERPVLKKAHGSDCYRLLKKEAEILSILAG